MAKVKSQFVCQSCGVNSPKWVGKCPSCEEWNTYVEEIIEKAAQAAGTDGGWAQVGGDPKRIKVQPLSSIVADEHVRIPTSDEELDRTLGGGIVAGSIVLIGGEPGIGKSTLMLQLALNLQACRVLYVSGEESAGQIRLRADRLGQSSEELFLSTETVIEKVFKQVKELQPNLLVIDSIQTVVSNLIDATPGSVSQIRTCAAELQRFAKESDIPVFLIGHINKEGSIAGPKILEHMVDTVLQFEGDRHHSYRILRTIKNRFGSTAELGIYEMMADGLRQVSNPSEILMGQREEVLSGISIAATVEGLRPMLIETQALVSQAVYGNPQRSATGFDLRRLNMLLAVLEKRCGFAFGTKDVFLNMAGGLKVEDPAIDLAVVCALLSSFQDIPLPIDACFCGEVGLSGEIRSVTRAPQRIAEAERLGFKRIFISRYNSKGLEKIATDIELVMVGRVDEVLQHLFQFT